MTTLELDSPAGRLILARQGDVVAARTALLARIDAAAPELAVAISCFLSTRATDMEVPSIGEVWPWLLADLVGIPAHRAAQAAQPWIALYWYTLIIDKHCDGYPNPTPPSEILAATLLFELGLTDLLDIAVGGQARSLMRSAMHEAIRYQSRDIQTKAQSDDIVGKRHSAASKNAGFVAGAAALAALAEHEPGTLVTFSRAVLLALQHMDDLADYEDDFRSQNITPLLLGLGDFDPLQRQSLTRFELLETLILSGALSSILAETKTVLHEARMDLSQKYPISENSAAGRFLSDLIDELRRCERYVRYAMPRLTETATHNLRHHYLAEVDKRLLVVAQHS